MLFFTSVFNYKFNLKKLVQNFILLFVSTLIILTILEGFSRIYFKHSYTHVVDEKGNVVSMQIDPGHPEIGLHPGFCGRMKSGEFDIEIKLDSLGLRSPIQVGEVSESLPLYLTLLGDSFMFGWGVELKDSYAKQLANELNRLLNRPIYITNLAIPGTGQVTHLKMLINKPLPEPDIIIAGLYMADHPTSGNDLIDNMNDVYKKLNLNFDTNHENEELNKVGFLRSLRRILIRNSNLYRCVET